METIKYDPVDFLDDNESIKAYLQEVIDDGDPKLISSAIYDVLRALKKKQRVLWHRPRKIASSLTDCLI